ncbi:chondroitinase family polysaccharide lyase [Mariniflexile ostreae]|uniref:Chondroitinase family polysaccharide lyase n=1 Tax=Mariniflexile ostreae TaxID=1520892 RepID=A0ABV5FFW4_9FLAO
MKTPLHIFFYTPKKPCFWVLLCTLCITFNLYAQDESFETTVPSHWSTTNGTLNTSTDHYKLGSKSLRWDWNANAVITVNNLQDHGLVKSEVLGFYHNMFRMWLYNTGAIQTTPLTVEFYDNTDALRFFYTVQLNFTGWRAASASYVKEMSGNKNSDDITTMKIKAPDSGSGTFFFDFIDYTMARNTSRSADYQLPFINLNNGEHWGDIMYFQSLPKTVSLASPTAQELTDLASVKQKYDTAIKGNAPTASHVAGAISRYHALNISYEAGLVKGTPLYGQDFPNAQNIKAVEDFILNFARDFAHKSTTSSRDYFLNTVRYLLDQGFADGSMMETIHHIGYNFRNIPSAIHLMKEELELAGLWEQAQKMVEWYTAVDGIWEPRASNSNMDDANTRSLYRLGACLYKTTDAEKVQYLKGYKKYLENFLTRYPKEGQGMKVDFTGFHHNIYYPGYAFLGYNELGKVINYTSGGIFALATQHKDVLKKSLLLARVSSTGGDIPNALAGRNPFFNPSFKNGLKDLGLASPVDTELIKAHNYMYGSDSQTASYGSETPPNGFWQVNFANLGVYRQSDWVANMKGFNKYFYGSEIYPSENRYGRYQSYGAVEVMYPGGHANSKLNINGWDWRKIPGATTKHLSWNDLLAVNSRQDEKTDSNFAASLRFGSKANYYIDSKIEGNYGVFGMDFEQKAISFKHDSNFKFKKSVFCFDGKLICLGSNISSGTGLVATNLFQNYLSSTSLPIHVNHVEVATFPYNSTLSSTANNWLIDAAHTGYFVKSGNTVVIDRKNQDAPSEKGNGTMTNGDFASAYISHAAAPNNAGYEYVILPGTNATEMENFSTHMANAATAFYQVIQKDQFAHIVKYNNIYGYALFDDANYGTQTPIKENLGPCLVMLQDHGESMELSVVSPDLNFAVNNGNSQTHTIDLTIHGEWNLNTSYGGNVSVITNTGETQLVIELKEGLPVDITLTKGAVNTDYPIIFYEDFSNEIGSGFIRNIKNTGGHTDDSKIFKRVSDIPDATDTNNEFDPNEDRPSKTIPVGQISDQRALSIVGNNGTTNFPLDAYAIFTTLDLTDNNPRISPSDTYAYASFWTERRYGDGDIATISLLVTTAYTGDPATTSWTNLPLHSGKLAETADGLTYVKGVVDLSPYAHGATGASVTVALRYQGSSSAYSSSNRNGTFYFSDLQFFVQSSPLEVENHVLMDEDVSIYPNPSSDFFNIKISNPHIKVHKVCLIDMYGKIIYNSFDTDTVRVNGAPKGLYLLRLETQTGNIIHKKIIID